MTTERPGLSDPNTVIAAIDAGDEAALRHALDEDPLLAGSTNADGVKATLHALYRGRVDLARILAERLAAPDLFEAAALGRFARVTELLRADPGGATRRSPDGFTALHFPGFFGAPDAAEISRVLLEAGADVNARSENAMSVLPLHSAVAGNHADVAAVLIEAGADVNAKQRHGWTPLHGAAQNGAVETVERLLAAGADPTLRNDDGVSAEDLAREAGHLELAERLAVAARDHAR
jgi:uncharacterized protein